jgi:hypothetical protein
MLIMSKILTGAAGLVMVAGTAAPAAAQSYPYNGYGNSNGNVVGQLVNQVLGGGANGQYGQYGQGNERVAVDQCARAAQARVSGAGYGGYNQGYNQGYGYNGYNRGSAAQVVGITSVERKSNGLKVSGVMSSGIANRGAYGNQYGNQGYNQGYGNQGYGNQGYGNQGADLRFSCRVDYRGYVSNIDIKRMNPVYRRGY